MKYEITSGDDGEYRTVNNNGKLTVYKYNRCWRKDDLIGNKYIMSLVQKIEELENEIVDMKEENFNNMVERDLNEE